MNAALELDRFRQAVSIPDNEIDLAEAVLLSAGAEYPELNRDEVLSQLDRRAEELGERLGPGAPWREQIETLNAVVFQEMGLRGAGGDYHNPSNFYINAVLQDKTGVSMALAIIYMAIGARAGIALAGTSIPMHFMVRVLGVKPPWFVDCYNQGRLQAEETCRRAFKQMARWRFRFRDEMLEVAPNAQVLARLLENLKMIYLNRLDYAKAIGMIDRLVILDPQRSTLRRERGLAFFRLGELGRAKDDLLSYLACPDEPEDAQSIRKLLRILG